MSEMDRRPDPTSDLVIERGGKYDHAEHGPVTVTGIWKGVHQVDRAGNTDETGIIIVRYTTEQENKPADVGELIDTLDEFLTAIE